MRLFLLEHTWIPGLKCTQTALCFAPPNIRGQILTQPESDDFKGPKDLAKKILAYYMMSLKGVSKKV